MAGSLEKIPDDELRPRNVRKRLGTIKKLVALYNAFLNCQILTTTGQNKLTITESNATLELNITGGAATAAATPVPWQPYAAPAVGTNSADPLSLKIRPCWVWDGFYNWFPSNKNASFAVPPSQTDGYLFWLEADIGPTGQITALQYNSGADGPPRAPDASTTTGAPPAKAYYSLFHVTSNATAIDDFSNLYAPPEPLTLLPIQVVISTSPSFPQMVMRWLPFSADPLAQ